MNCNCQDCQNELLDDIMRMYHLKMQREKEWEKYHEAQSALAIKKRKKKEMEEIEERIAILDKQNQDAERPLIEFFRNYWYVLFVLGAFGWALVHHYVYPPTAEEQARPITFHPSPYLEAL